MSFRQYICSVSPIWEVSEQLISITSRVMIYTHVFILIRPHKKIMSFFLCKTACHC
jgi:hypothetical protein